MIFYYIYGLIDPRDHQIKYVGQSRNPEGRLLGHLSAAVRGTKPVHTWLRSLRPTLPLLVILESVAPRMILVGANVVNSASVMEAKWLKRFRRTVLNYNKKQCAAYDAFVNPPEVIGRFYAQRSPSSEDVFTNPPLPWDEKAS